MDRYPDSPRDEIFTLARRVTTARDREYIRDLEEGIKTVGRVLNSYKDENRRLRTEVGDLRERIYKRVTSFNCERIKESRSKEDSSDCEARGRRLVMERKEDGNIEIERRDARSMSNIGVKRYGEEVSSPRYQVHESVRPFRGSEDPTAAYGMPMGDDGGKQEYDFARQYDRRPDQAENVTDVRDYAYSQDPKPEPAAKNQTWPISEDEKAGWKSYVRRIPVHGWEAPGREFHMRTGESSDHRNYGPLRQHSQDRDDIDIEGDPEPNVCDHAYTQDSSPKIDLENQPKSASSDEKTMWQGHYSPSSSQTTERTQTTSSVWERRETLDGLYRYYLNTKDGRMTDPQPIPRDESEGEEFDLHKLRVTPQSPPVSRKAARTASQGKDILPALPVEVPYRYKNIAELRVGRKEPAQVLGSTSRNNSNQSSENFPPSPRSYYRDHTHVRHDLQRSVFKPVKNAKPVLPRPPIGLYNNREYAQQYSSRKVTSSNQLPRQKVTSKTPAAPALNSTSTNTSPKSSEITPPSPRSHYGFAVNPAIPKPASQMRAAINPSHHSPTRPAQPLNLRNQPAGVHGGLLSTFAEAYGEPRGNYKIPFANTVTDIDDRERRTRDFLRAPNHMKTANGGVGEVSVPIRSRANARGSEPGTETNTRRKEKEVAESEYKSGGAVRWTGSS